MFRFLGKLLLTLILAATTAAGLLLYFSGDWLYTARELVEWQRFRQFDRLIIAAAEKHRLDPMLVKSVIWRESTFRPDMLGTSGERGLMQIMEPAARDWEKANNVTGFEPEQLFDPKTNIEVGTWYLAQAIRKWADKDDPIPFALAEYNAGRTRVNRWIEDTRLGKEATADDMRERISIPSTRRYVETILARYRFYKDRGRM